MIILPAIDIINKQPVRLYQGDYAKKKLSAKVYRKLPERLKNKVLRIFI